MSLKTPEDIMAGYVCLMSDASIGGYAGKWLSYSQKVSHVIFARKCHYLAHLFAYFQIEACSSRLQLIINNPHLFVIKDL